MKIKIALIATILFFVLLGPLILNNKANIKISQNVKTEIPPSILENKNINEIVQEKHDNDNFIGTLEIKKIKMKGVIIEGSNENVLKDYIGHIENTPIYNGNVCLAAHNRGNKYSYFANINTLTNGDEMSYTTKFGEEKYIVDNVQEIDEQDWSLLENTNEDKITLITCVKDKKEKRLCVQGTKIE